ncbi:MAG: Fe-S cluster assembly protein SufD [Proteobacteria bacterium]|nr:Fe-S cluster assembly protein SufD [Pseudomonadota bacterium]
MSAVVRERPADRAGREALERALAAWPAAAAQLPGARGTFVAKLREEALARFCASGFPTARDEDWKYTDLAALAARSFLRVPDDVQAATTEPLPHHALFDDLGGHRLAFVDGRHAPELSSIGPMPDGVRIESLAAALARDPAALETWLADTRGHSAMAALNTAFLADGALVIIPAGVEVAEPIHLVFLAATAATIQPRNLIIAGERSKCTVVEHYAGSAPAFTNALTQLFLAGGAETEYCKLQDEGERALHVGGLHVAQARGSRFGMHSVSVGAALARHDLTAVFDGEGCTAAIDGLYLAGGRQHVDHHTRIDHAQPRGTSREHFRGILDGRSRGVFNGRVVVHPGAQQSDAWLTSRNLLLSADAEADTKPQLEIYADDVKCAHGATVGQLDENELFYLRARGFDAAAARSLLTWAFARSALEGIRLTPLRAHLERACLGRLPQALPLAELM